MEPMNEPGAEGARPRLGGAPALPPSQQWKPLPFRPRRGRLGSQGGGAAAGAGSARPLLPVPPRPAPPPPGCCQLPQRPAGTLCMLSSCGSRLLLVLGLGFPLVARRPLFLCPHRLMKPLVVFVLGGPGAGKGTQCARIVEVRPRQLAIFWA